MSNKEERQIQKIRAQYLEQPPTEMDALRALDASVKRPATVFAYIFGSIAAIIMGCGMSLIMTDIAETLALGIDPLLPGIVIGCIGMLMALINYPIYKGILNSRKKKYGEKILTLSEQIMNQ